MITSHEEILAAGVNARIEQRKKEERSRWLKSIYEDCKPFIFSLMGVGVISWLASLFDENWIYPLFIAAPILGVLLSAAKRFREQKKTIEQLAQRLAALERRLEENRL